MARRCWSGPHDLESHPPTIRLNTSTDEKGIALTKQEMLSFEDRLDRNLPVKTGNLYRHSRVNTHFRRAFQAAEARPSSRWLRSSSLDWLIRRSNPA
jgi:hypothetical protein